MPTVFAQSYLKTFCIMDATEPRRESPSSLSGQSQLQISYHTERLSWDRPQWSIYSRKPAILCGYRWPPTRHRQWISPKLLETVSAGCSIMADRAYEIQDPLGLNDDIILNAPRFKGSQLSMPLENVIKTQKIANACIHVERAIGCEKELFHLLDRETSLTLAVAGSINQV